jgi:hypothetical protein
MMTMPKRREVPQGSVSDRPARYRFCLHPGMREWQGACPICSGPLIDLIAALVVVIEPGLPLALRFACLHCASCDLLIAHQDELEMGMEQAIAPVAPEAIGNEYQVIGTMDLADWERSRAAPLTTAELAAVVHLFQGEVVLEEDEAPGDNVIALVRSDAAKPDPWKKSMSVPKALRPAFDEVVRRTDAFCSAHLTDEYAELCRALTAALCRKRPSPLAQGKLDSWACGIVYTVGAVNFLFDKSQTPHMRAMDLCRKFGFSQATGSARGKTIRDLLKIQNYDPHWCLPSKLDQHPFVWMIMVNGFPLDARYAPRPVQEEAVRRGVIPYVPRATP